MQHFMEKTGFLLICVLSLCQSCNDCVEYAKEFRNEAYHFQVHKKYKEGRNTVFEGSGQKFEIVGWEYLLDTVRIGDTFLKEKGSTVVKIIKKDTVYEFPAYCSDLPMDQYVR